MSEFPREQLELMWVQAPNENLAATVRQAIKAYDELSTRCVMGRAELSAEIGNLRRENGELNAAIDETLARVDLLRAVAKTRRS